MTKIGVEQSLARFEMRELAGTVAVEILGVESDHAMFDLAFILGCGYLWSTSTITLTEHTTNNTHKGTLFDENIVKL